MSTKPGRQSLEKQSMRDIIEDKSLNSFVFAEKKSSRITSYIDQRYTQFHGARKIY